MQPVPSWRVALAGLVALGLACPCWASVYTLWPLPVEVSSGESNVTVYGTSFELRAVCANNAILASALKRFSGLFFPFGTGGRRVPTTEPSSLTVLEVCISSAQTVGLSVDTNTAYSLNVSASSAAISAANVFGALHALETFSQLISYVWQTDSYVIEGVPLAIADGPRFAWRGLLVDTARHYYDVESLLHTIDVMAQNKLNVLHWHIVDAQSFPLVSSAYPNLSGAGAYHPTAVYRAADVSLIVDYAYERGVNVMIELDGPGHSYSMSLGYPELGVVCPEYEANINNIPQNPIVSNGISSLAVVEALFNETVSLLPFGYLHTGGDEVVTECWADNGPVQAWMTQHGLDPMGVYQYFEDAYQAMAAALNRTVLIWEDPFDNGLKIPPETIIEVWRSQATLQQVVAAGYRAILAAPFYLDQQLPNATATHYEWEDTWQNFWGVDMTAGLSEAQAALVLGGEACMWSEQVMPTNFDSRVWPRASGAAERFWSPAAYNLTDAITRLNAHSCRMQVRGVYCGPIAPSFCLLPQSPFKREEL